MKWRYQKEKPKKSKELFIRLQEGKRKSMKIRGWNFEKAPNGSLFKCEVIEEDGQPADKFWYVWDYELREALKKRLKGMKSDRRIVDITVTKRIVDDEDVFELA